MAEAKSAPGIIQIVASSRGGGAEHVRCLVKGMKSQSYKFTVVMSEDGGHLGASDFEVQGARFVPLELAQGFSMSTLLRLRSMICRSHCDVVHCHGMRAAMYGRLAAMTLRKRPRIVFTIHGFAAIHYSLPKRQALLSLERCLARVTDAWICVSNAEKEALLSAGVVDAGRVHVIHNGIDIERFATVSEPRQKIRMEIGVPTNAVLITTVCRLYRPRDFPTLLYAFRRLRNALPHIYLLIVGDGPLCAQIKHLITSLALEDQVGLLGMRRDVPRILHATDVFVLSSKGWEGLPLTVLEAMASALPVVASDVGGTREAVVDLQTGYLFPPGDITALARCIRTLVDDSALAQRMGQQGLARVRRLFTLQRMARDTAALYEELMS